MGNRSLLSFEARCFDDLGPGPSLAAALEEEAAAAAFGARGVWLLLAPRSALSSSSADSRARLRLAGAPSGMLLLLCAGFFARGRPSACFSRSRAAVGVPAGGKPRCLPALRGAG